MPPATASAPRPIRPSGLLPPEHGAYGQLAFPLLSVLLRGGVPRAGWEWSAAFVAAFFAHEPLLVLWGRRGARLRDQYRTQAAVQGGGLVLAAAGFGLDGWMHAAPPARWALTVVLGLAGVRLLQIARAWHRGLTAELTATASLCCLALPVALSAGWSWSIAWLTVGVWCVVLGTAVVSVQGVIRRQKSGSLSLLTLSPVMAGLVALALLLDRDRSLGLVLVPALLTALYLRLRPPSPRYLRRIGFSLLAVSAATLMLLLAA